MNDGPMITIIGAGRSGRGMLGEMFYSEGGFRLVFADIDSNLVRGLSKQGYYTVEQKNLLTGECKKTCVEGFEVVDTVREHRKYMEYLSDSEMIGTALFPSAFDQVAKDLTEMVRMRKGLKKVRPVAILLGGNFVGLEQYFYTKISASLEKDELDYFHKYIALVTAKVNRKVVYPDNFLEDSYFLTGDDKEVLMVDKKFLFPKSYHYPSFFVLKENMELGLIEKIWSENLRHVTFAFIGSFYGYETINEAVRDSYVRKSAYYAWKEGRRALLEEYGLPIPDDNAVKTEFEKFASPFFEDRLSRIGREPIRKLKRNDRLVGPALLCLRHRIVPYFISRSIAYGFFYHDPADEEACKLQRYVHEEGIERAILQYCQLSRDEPCENILFQLILRNYDEIADRNVIPAE